MAANQCNPDNCSGRGGKILLQVQTAQPANTEARGHVFFGDTNLTGVGWTAQTPGEKLYARALQGTASIVLSPDIA